MLTKGYPNLGSFISCTYRIHMQGVPRRIPLCFVLSVTEFNLCIYAAPLALAQLLIAAVHLI